QAEDGIRYRNVTGVQTCALPIYLDSAFLNVVSSIMERKLTGVDDWFGTSIPTKLVPGIGASIRISLAANAILISSCKLVILETFTPFSTDNSKRVTLGPSVTV